MARIFQALAVLLVTITLPACKPPAQAQGGHAEGDGHDHGAEGDTHEAEAEAGHVDEVVLAPDAIRQYGITTEAAQLWNLRPTFVAPARVAFNAEAMAHVGTPLAGRAVELKVRLGDKVAAGDALIVVESPDLGAAQSDYLIKRTMAETAAPAVDLAKAAYDRAKALYDSPDGIAMTLTEVQKREVEHRAAIASLRSAEGEAQAAENHLHLLGMSQQQIKAIADTGEVNPRYTIVSPIAGQVVQREVTLGEMVNPDREALLVITDMTTLWVLADVPEARLGEVGVGSKAWIRIGGVQGSQFEGAVAFISPIVDSSTRTAQVRIEVTNLATSAGGGALKPGMFAQVEVVTANPNGEQPAPAIAVPEAAVQTVEGGPAVFVPVAGEANTFAKRAIVIGKTIGGLVPIQSGLVEGELFVATGSFILKAELGKGSAEHSH